MEVHPQEDFSDLTSSYVESLSTVLPSYTPDSTDILVVTSVSVGRTQGVLHSNEPINIFNSSLSIPVLGSLAAAVFFILVFILARRGKSSTKGSAILLTGPSDAGKTAIFSALVYQHVLPSHTSLQTNTSLITLSSSLSEKQQLRTIQLLDIPGHPRIRDQFKDHLAETKGVVFVVDASTIARNGAAVAEHLHYILHALTSLPPSRSPPSLVILAHKCDLLATSSSSATTLAVSRVRTILERELEKRRASQAGGVGVGQLGEDEGADAELGGLECSGPGGGFRFKDWEGGEIEILGSSLNIDRGGIDPEKVPDGLTDFKQWLHNIP